MKNAETQAGLLFSAGGLGWARSLIFKVLLDLGAGDLAAVDPGHDLRIGTLPLTRAQDENHTEEKKSSKRRGKSRTKSQSFSTMLNSVICVLDQWLEQTLTVKLRPERAREVALLHRARSDLWTRVTPRREPRRPIFHH